VRKSPARALWVFLLFLWGCSSNAHEESHPKFLIWVVGHGDPYNALWAGAQAGWKQALADENGLKRIVDLKFEDDHHLPSEAANIARKLRKNPFTLAVIGHDQSNTTFAAEPIYADAGIPIIFASATSPQIGRRYPYRGVLFKSSDTIPAGNFVRLPPPDAPYQSHALRVATFAIAEKIKHRLKGPLRIYLVRETSKSAEVYSDPIADALAKDTSFSQLVVGERQFDHNQLDVYTLVTSIRGEHADLVIFIGYAESALDLLQEMKERVQQDTSKGQAKSEAPSFLLTDACLTKDIADSGFPFDIYVTSSTLPLEECEPPDEQAKKNRAALQPPDNRPLTSEVYGFDAAHLLSRAISYCGQNLSRQCIISYIRQQRTIESVCRPYHIDDGESGNGVYLLYAHTRIPKTASGQFDKRGFIRADHENLLQDTKLP
jgi:ABC-type branched-subunit amino acid transport system substrate-binding protein